MHTHKEHQLTKQKQPPGPKPKGHWPKGKRRNPVGDWPALRLAIVGLIDAHRLYGVRSAGALAKAVGVQSATVSRWLRGEDVPAMKSAEQMNAWLVEQRAAVKRELTAAANSR